MLLGRCCFGKRYGLYEYAFMLLVVCGLVTFLLARSTGAIDASLVGIALLALAVVCDSVVPNVQQRLLETRPKQELVFHTNWVSALLTACYMGWTGEGARAIAFCERRPRVLGLLLIQATCGYLGILVYLETVRAYGPKVTVVITSCRKLFTIALSSLAFGHQLTGFHLVGVGTVFLGITLNVYADARPSRLLAPPSLLAVALLVALELGALDGTGLEWIRSLRTALSSPLL